MNRALVALRSAMTAGLVVGWLGGVVAALVVGIPAGVLLPAAVSPVTVGLYYFSLVGTCSLLFAVVVSPSLLACKDPLAVALAGALAASFLGPLALHINVRHLPGVLTAASLAANCALLATFLLLTKSLVRGTQSRLTASAPSWRTVVFVAIVTVLPVALLPVTVSHGVTTPERLTAGPAAARPQTLLLITVDTLRADRLGCYGYRRETSPRIDRFALQGTVYDRAFSQAPNTHPSMAAMLTEAPLTAFDHLALRDFVPPGTETLAKRLRRLGYATGAVVSNPYLKREMGFAQGFETFDDHSAMVGNAASVTDAALAVAAELDGPKFLWVHYLDPHHPYLPPAPFDTTFGARLESVDSMQSRPDLTEHLIAAGRGDVRLSEQEWNRLEELYDGEVRYSDEQIGRLIDELTERGDLDDARVLITADHGEEFRDHGGVLHSHTLYSELVRLPLIVWSPGRPPVEGRSDLPIGATHFGRLLIDGEVPGEEVLLSEKLHDERARPPQVSLRTADYTMVTAAYRPYTFGYDPRRILRSLREMALFAPHAFDVELYRASDRHETHDIAEQKPEVLQELGRKLRSMYRSTRLARGGDAMPSEDTLEQLRGLGYLGE